MRNPSRLWALAFLLAAVALPAEANVFISSQPTSNMSCSAGTCTPTANPANLNATDLAGMLASGDVTVTTDNGPYIYVKSSFGWASVHRLTLEARNAITIEAPVVVSGPGGLAIDIVDQYGALSFGPNGRAIFRDLSSSFVMDGYPFLLVGDMDGLVSTMASHPAGHIALARDARSTASYGASPIPTTFSGTFEGLGNRIFYLRIDDTAANQHDGLFATIGVHGAVRDLGLVKAKVQGTSGSSIGALAGENNGRIEGSYATGMVLHTGSGGSLGGLVGSNMRQGTVADSWSEASVRGQSNVLAGGLAGTNSGQLFDTRAGGSVTGGNNASAGGLVGTNSATSIVRSQASGAVTAGSAALAGGLVGQGRGGISESFATGAVRVGNLGKAGGLQGVYAADVKFPTSLWQSYATGSVTGQNAELGSLLGECCLTTKSVLTGAYGTGAVSGAAHATIGGVVGNDDEQATWTSAYWDTDTTGVSNPGQGAGNIANDPGLIGLSDEQLKSALPAGFSSSEWGQSASINNGYPYLLDNPPQ